MDPEELARQEAAAAAAEARLAALTGGDGDPPPDPPAEDPPADPPAEDPPAEDPPAEDPPADPSEAPPAHRRGSRTLEARISGLAADKRALSLRTAELEAENARLRAGAAPPADPPAGDPPPEPQRNQFRTQAEFNAAVVAEAQRQADLREWNNRCNAVEDKGSKLGERWNAAKRNLALLDDNGVIPFPILEMALETDAPEKVLLTLGEDPDRAAEILAMRPAKRALEIAKMAAGPAPKIPARSEAPPPVEPLKGRGAPAAAAAPTDRDSDDEWLRKRNADIDAKRIAAAARQRSMS